MFEDKQKMYLCKYECRKNYEILFKSYVKNSVLIVVN